MNDLKNKNKKIAKNPEKMQKNENNVLQESEILLEETDKNLPAGQQQEKHLKEQDDVLANTKKNMLVSASAGSGKTYIMIKYICQLVVDKRVPISDFLVLTFTKSAANQMKEKLLTRLKQSGEKAGEFDEYIAEQIDALSTANICTIDAFCERALKKYSAILGINESFSVVDESQAKNLKDLAFEKAYKNFAQNFPQEFELLTTSYKNDQEKIKKIVGELAEISNAVSNRSKFLTEIGENFEEKFENACKLIFENFQKTVSKKLQELESFHVDVFENKMKQILLPATKSTDLFELFSTLQKMPKFPSRPNKNQIGEANSQKIGELKDAISDQVDLVKSLCLDDEENVGSQKAGDLETAFLKLFDLYEKEYSRLKNAQNCMDFADLEKYMRILAENEKLFDGFQYVFVDEYQDTNKLQEEIIKKIAKNCNFVAVGDLKQGIYGFRLASAEIFLKDMKEFAQDENSAVNFLKSNFRSDQKVLDFVNDIFKVCMTEEIAGVDYFSTSMLEAQNDFVDDGKKAVNIDLVVKNPTIPDEIPKIYSVKNAQIKSNNSSQTLLLDIKRRINEVLGSKISVGGVLRQATFGDIAILSRSRDAFFNQLETFLQENGIPLISNSRTKLTSEPEIQMLVNYLRLALCLDDEVALLSVLLSGLYLLDVQKIFDEKFSANKTLLEVVKENKSGYFSKFLQDLEEFRLDAAVFGAKKAFLTLFAKNNYFSYLNLRKGSDNLRMMVDRFLLEVEKQDFDIPALVHFFDTVEIVVSPEASAFGDCVRLTTVHDSKGLEYPIVFLVNCDKNFLGDTDSDVQISEKYGMALKVFDIQENKSTPSVRLCAIREDEKEKDFVEELMIFYVALTRAKNRLYLFGNYDEKFFTKHDIRNCKTYFDLIFLALPKAKDEFLASGKFENDNLSINLIEDVQELLPEKSQNLEEAEFDDDVVKKIEKYLDFSYKFGESKNFRLKESVTGLSNRFQESTLEKFSNENFSFGGDAVATGNAYHLALKLLDFDNITDEQTLAKGLQKIETEVDLALIDKQILLKNILILKDLTAGAKIFKEKEFLLKEKVSALLDDDVEDKILVQGVVDLFAIKEGKIVLIDFKFSSHENEQYLKDKYINQLKLYKIALEEAFHLPVERCFLLSLKFSKLIPLDI